MSVSFFVSNGIFSFTMYTIVGEGEGTLQSLEFKNQKYS